MKSDSRAKDLVASYSTAIISGLMSKVSALSLNHKLTQGELTELFITNVLSLFLTKQFDTGTGVIISSKQEESDQTDIIIYDNRILPPFIKESHIGVYPAESIVGVISVRSQLDGTVIKKIERSFKKLHEKIYNPASRLYGSDRCMEPICAIVGLYWKNNAKQNFLTRETGKRWLENNIKYSDAICLIENFSWLKINQWVKSRDEENFEETKRFIAVFLDSLRTRSEKRLHYMSQFRHKDWLSVYIRGRSLSQVTEDMPTRSLSELIEDMPNWPPGESLLGESPEPG